MEFFSLPVLSIVLLPILHFLPQSPQNANFQESVSLNFDFELQIPLGFLAFPVDLEHGEGFPDQFLLANVLRSEFLGGKNPLSHAVVLESSETPLLHFLFRNGEEGLDLQSFLLLRLNGPYPHLEVRP